MNKTFVGILGFLIGAGAGVLSTKAYFEKKYSDISRAEIDNVKEAYGRKYEPVLKEIEGDVSRKPHVLKPSITPEDKKTYLKIIENHGYSGESDFPSEEQDPKVITPEEFGTEDDYDIISLTYYSDGILADENFHLMTKDEIEESVGSESLTHFGEYEDDSVFVRNDRRKIDYEILKDPRSYEDAIHQVPQIKKNEED